MEPSTQTPTRRIWAYIYHVQGDETMVPKLVAEAYAGYKTSKTCLCGQDRVLPEVAFFF